MGISMGLAPRDPLLEPLEEQLAACGTTVLCDPCKSDGWPNTTKVPKLRIAREMDSHDISFGR
jgi:hypothetical protein